MTRKIDAIAQQAMNLLIENGVETAMIIAKCPDSDLFGLNIKGSRPYVLGVNDMCRDLMKNEMMRKNFSPPPPPDKGDDWKNK